MCSRILSALWYRWREIPGQSIVPLEASRISARAAERASSLVKVS